MRRGTVRAAGTALVSGVLLGSAYPPVGPGFMAWVALVPLLWWMEDKRPGRIFRWVFFSGVIFHLFTLSWLRHITSLGMVCAIIALSLVYAVPFWMTGIAWARWRRYGVFLLPFAVAGFLVWFAPAIWFVLVGSFEHYSRAAISEEPEKSAPPAHFENEEKLIDIFGYWPSFHDAEILRIRLDRAGSDGPSLTADIHVFEMKAVSVGAYTNASAAGACIRNRFADTM